MPAIAVALFVLGFWGAGAYIHHVPVADTFDGLVEFDLWAFLLGALTGLGLASGVLCVVWLIGLIGLSDRVRVSTALSWLAVVVVVLATVFAFLFVGADGADDSVDKTLAMQARPLTVVAALSQLPGLVAFLTVRFVASDEASWQESGTCRLRLVLRLRAELQRLLTTFGAFLTLLVVVAGMRRKALLALDPALPIPAEVVLLYGLLFAVVLGLFYAVAAGAIDRRAQRLLDEFAPLPDPADLDLSDKVRRRNDLSSLTGGGGTWGTFQTTVVIAAPLLTGLLSSAIGG